MGGKEGPRPVIPHPGFRSAGMLNGAEMLAIYGFPRYCHLII